MKGSSSQVIGMASFLFYSDFLEGSSWILMQLIYEACYYFFMEDFGLLLLPKLSSSSRSGRGTSDYGIR